MRISTNQLYQNGLANLLTQQERVSQLQNQLSNGGLRVGVASDDPIAFAEIEWLTERVATTEVLQKNCKAAENALNLEESVLTDCVSVMQTLREIQVRSSNGALSQADRQAYVTQVTEILTQLVGFANAKDNEGSYLFAGGQSSTLPFTLNTAGQYVYNGDSTQRFQLISSSLQVGINNPGDNLFMCIPSGNGSFSVNAAAGNTGTGVANTGSVTSPAAYIPDDYSINFSLNASGELVVMVSGAASGNVIPADGLPSDAPVYQDGMSLSFNGMAIQLSGAPQAGDSFAVNPAQNVSLFATIQAMINNLNMPFNAAKEKAAVATENNQLLAQIDSALQNISNVIASIGSRLNQVDYSIGSNEDLIDASEITLKSLRETDPLEVATEMQLQLVNLQAAEQSFVLIQNLSIFNYI